MGGFGSGKGIRCGFRRGPGRKRRYAEEFFTFDIRQQTPDHWKILEAVSSFPGAPAIKIIQHCSPSGGLWSVFSCPGCGRGSFKLYFSGEGLRCRCCLRLAYRRENRGKTDRAIDRKWDLIYQLGPSPYFNAPLKPKGMHRKTYERQLERIKWYDSKAAAHFFKYPKGACPDRSFEELLLEVFQ